MNQYQAPTKLAPLGLFVTAVVIATVLLVGCGEEEEQELPFFDFPLEVEATDLTGDPVAGIPVLVDDRVVGFTDADGVFKATINEQPTVPIRLSVDETEGYRLADDEPYVEESLRIEETLGGGEYRGLPVSLRVNFETTLVEHLAWIDISCDDDLDDEYCESVPILLDDEQKVRTNQNGFAHFSFVGVPGDQHTITVDMPSHDPDDDDSIKIEPDDTDHDIELSTEPTVFHVEEEFTDPDAGPTWRPRPRPQPQQQQQQESSADESDDDDDDGGIPTIF